MRPGFLALALISSAALPVWAQDANAPSYNQQAWGPVRRPPQAREGLLVSFGLGGGSAYLSTETLGHERVGAFDFDFRLGYGFSDRFQLFMDLSGDSGRYPNSADFASWTFTLRGQTVLIGDRAGNGLNVNFGVGVGGVDYYGDYCCYSYSTTTGLALAGGLSYDARLTPWFSLSPEFFVNWHDIPNGLANVPNDVSNVIGMRLNFLWYLK